MALYNSVKELNTVINKDKFNIILIIWIKTWKYIHLWGYNVAVLYLCPHGFCWTLIKDTHAISAWRMSKTLQEDNTTRKIREAINSRWSSSQWAETQIWPTHHLWRSTVMWSSYRRSHDRRVNIHFHWQRGQHMSL